MPTITAKLEAVTAQTAGVRRWGAASLDFAFVAAGRYDAFFEYGLAPWDVAAGLLLVREAGGIVSDVTGKPYELGGPSVLASNFGMHEPMIEILGASCSAGLRPASEMSGRRPALPVRRHTMAKLSTGYAFQRLRRAPAG